MPEAPGCRSTFWLTCIQIDPKAFGSTREELRLALEEANIESRLILAEHPVVGGRVAEVLFGNGLCLPSGSSMTDEDRERVVGVILRVAEEKGGGLRRRGYSRPRPQPGDESMRLALLIAVVMTPVFADAWDGYDSSTGAPVDIERGNLVRSGRDIEIFDYEEGEYRDVHVERVRRSGRTVALEIYDYESGEYRYLDMFD